MDVHPVVGPVDGFGIPLQPLEVFIGQHSCSFTNVSRFENETIVEHERKKLIERDFLRTDLPPRVPKAFQIRIDFLSAQQSLAQSQCSMHDVKPAMQPRAARLKLINRDHLGFDIRFPNVGEAAARFLVLVFVPRVHSKERDEARQHDRILIG